MTLSSSKTFSITSILWSRKRCVWLWRCDVMVFESLTLTPFCMEILGVRKWIFQCFNSVFSVILMESGKKYARTRPLSLFLQLFCRYSLFFFQGEINCWGGRDRKISALVSAPVSALYLTFKSQGWTALFDWADTLWPKV